jgi:predicted acyl esterase
VRIDRGVVMTTRDGVPAGRRLSPAAPTVTPTILVRIPFSQPSPTRFLQPSSALLGGRATVVIQDTRGRYQSGGARPLVDERRDGLETLSG